jgi:hypothetical protein
MIFPLAIFQVGKGGESGENPHAHHLLSPFRESMVVGWISWLIVGGVKVGKREEQNDGTETNPAEERRPHPAQSSDGE